MESVLAEWKERVFVCYLLEPEHGLVKAIPDALMGVTKNDDTVIKSCFIRSFVAIEEVSRDD